MEGSASAFHDWAHLPLLVLYLISEKVESITDYLRFRAVCSPWSMASLSKPRHLPPQLPWKMILYHQNYGCMDRKVDHGIRLFYDCWQSKMHKIHIPEIIKKMCYGSCRGWLLLADYYDKELFLLNPLTRAHVQLPPFTTPVKFLGARQDSRIVCCFLSSHNFMITKLSFSTDPTDSNCLIMVFLESCPQIFFCQIRDHCWSEIDFAPVVSSGLEDVAYNNGSFYFLEDRKIIIYDLNQQKMQGIYFFKPEFKPFRKLFFEGKSGLYVVAIHYTEEIGEEAQEEGTEKTYKQKFELYQVQKQEIELERIADDWDSLDGGCMYLKYMEHVQFMCVQSTGNDGDGSCYSILSAKLDDGTSELVAVGRGDQKLPFWSPFWSSLWTSPEPAMWFQPSFV